MIVNIIGTVIGALVLGAGLYYFAKEKNRAKFTASSARWAGCCLW